MKKVAKILTKTLLLLVALALPLTTPSPAFAKTSQMQIANH